MKIVVHDFSGHPGQIQLSRELARRGHDVEHQFCTSFNTGQGATNIKKDDPATLSIKGIGLSRDFSRYSAPRRFIQELNYGWLSVRAASAARPDVAIFSNMPLIPLSVVSIAARFKKLPYILWWQDVYSHAINTIARKRLGNRLGGLVGWIAKTAERGCAKRAAAVVPITESFAECLETWGVSPSRVTVIPNWGALDEIQPRPRSNSWSKAKKLDGVRVAMYTGTLGLKHDPSLLLKLARNAPDDCRVVVVSQGMGRQWLEQYGENDCRLVLLDFQPYEQLPNMLASADVLVAVLEEDASKYSVPSKVLSYLCAGRPVLAALPAENEVAHIIRAADAGVVVAPRDSDAASAALQELLDDAGLRKVMSSNARRFAEREFQIEAITDRFDTVIRDALRAMPDRRAKVTWPRLSDGHDQREQ